MKYKLVIFKQPGRTLKYFFMKRGYRKLNYLFQGKTWNHVWDIGLLTIGYSKDI